MSLYQKSVEKKYLNDLEPQIVEEKYAAYFNHFGNPVIQQNIKESKEEEYQEGFVRDLFVNILGYSLKPSPDYNLVLEKKNIDDSKKADGAIIRDEEVIAVIELKSTQTTDLDMVEIQAFGYKNHHPKCTYVITSNFEKIRLYIQNAVEYQEFDLFNLTKEMFSLLYLCLSKDSILRDLPLKIKESSVLQEASVTKKLYEDYSRFRAEIFDNIVKNNPRYDQLLLFRKTQKLLDRFLFIFFAEDRLLLPPNSISEIVKQWTTLKEELDAYVPLYDRFKKYFTYMNTGFKGNKYDIYPYNGGLFLPDDVLDNIKIDDEILHEHTIKLSAYDFETDIDVNILGHIFEHSIAEIENIQAKLRGEEIEKKKTKRKKEGVYYTPKYITKYIVENTVGKLCEEKREELGIVDDDYTPHRQKATKKKLLASLDKCREWLLGLTICDPACGSGAFLNQALDFLIKEHHKIDELQANLLGESIVFSDIETDILEKNLYGVDINDEAVEIAKLSLWLRTAKKGRKLSTLSNNIKVGNSLIDDPEVAGEKAFKWEGEFPKIFAKGGFDVVIGNPPYVVLSSFVNDEFEFLQKNYETAFGRLNLFALFIERSCKVLNNEGYVGLIIPDSLCLIDYYSDLRKFLLDKYSINGLFELGNGIFEDATVPALILLINGHKRENNIIDLGTNRDILLSGSKANYIEQDYYYKTPKNSFNLHIDEVFIKLNDMIDERTVYSLKNLLQIKIGICTGSNKKHLSLDPIFKNSKKVLQGKDINKYSLAWREWYVNYNRNELLRARDETIFLHKEKLLMRQTSDKLILTYDDNQYYTIDSLFIIYPKTNEINLKYCLALLNSKLLNRQYQKLNPETGRVFAQVKIDYVNELPIKLVSFSEQRPFIEMVNKTLNLNKRYLNEQKNLISTLLEEKQPLKLTKKIHAFYQLSYEEFKDVLKKQNVAFSFGNENDKWREYFNSTVDKIHLLRFEIEKTDNLINQMVYDLYGLTEEEIRIVEGEGN